MMTGRPSTHHADRRPDGPSRSARGSRAPQGRGGLGRRPGVAANRPAIDERGLALSVSVPDGEERLEADPTRLEQVLSNLLSNAAKYTDPGGHIRLDARREADEVVIRVGDTGIGIAPEMLPKVFDMFVQIERRLDRSRGGLGIGLSLAKNLVRMHGGSISAHSEGPGKGSEFVVRLPAMATEKGDPHGPAHRPTARVAHGPRG
ncbi:MAG: HAMP domain-containing sensor histidine kinase, partial [Singulisphaera sp.]